MRMVVGITAAMAMSVAVQAQQPATTVQQDFDTASKLDAGADPAAALAAWEALELRVGAKTRNRAIILVRKSGLLRRLGRNDEAVAAARAGLAVLPANDASLRGDRFSAHVLLGAVARDRLDYASAASEYTMAETLADMPVEKLVALFGVIETQTFVDPTVAAAAVARAEAVMANAEVDKRSRADFARRRAELLLNQGKFAEARRVGMEAVTLLGGLTSRTDLRDVSARSDVALASVLAGDDDTARRYMAYTGAGRLGDVTFDPAVAMEAPKCGGDAGLKPADVAVIQFSIGDDGQVIASTPVYAAGGGAVALEFARAALDWTWTPAQVKQLKPFFRYNARVEMRCSTAFERPGVRALLLSDLNRWLESRQVSFPDDPNPQAASALPAQRAALAAAEAASGQSSLAALPWLYEVMANYAVDREEAHALAERGADILAKQKAPASAQLLLDLWVQGTEGSKPLRSGKFADQLRPLLSRPVYANDPRAAAALRLLIVDYSKDRDDNRVLLRQVSEIAGLDEEDPFRAGALIRLASLEERAGNDAAAAAAYAKSGLSANQCAIVDATPKLLHAGGTFPQEAQAWGFEGWARTEFDIDADGKSKNVRTILAYPPFIFSKAGTRTLEGARFAKTFRPGGELGCGASNMGVKFRLP